MKNCTLDTLDGPILLKRLEVRSAYTGVLTQAAGGSLIAQTFQNGR